MKHLFYALAIILAAACSGETSGAADQGKSAERETKDRGELSMLLDGVE